MAAPGWKDRRDSADGKAAYEKREKRRTIRRLQEAIDNKDVVSVQDILQKDFDVDFCYRGQTALQLAVRLGVCNICSLLLDRGANVDEADGELNSLLNVACWNGYHDIAKLLIDRSANLDSENEAGSTPLHACAKKGRTSIATLLVTAKCNLNVPDRLGRTATMVATQSGQAEMVAFLARVGADMDWVDQHNKTPLMVSAEMGYIDIARILIHADANVNLQDRGGRTALMTACVNNHADIVQLLLDNHANPDLPATKGSTPLLEAVRNHNISVAQSLLKAGCDINLADRMHQAPLHEAIRKVAQYFDPAESEEAVSLVKRLVTMGANLNVADNSGWTPLYQAAYGSHLELTELLVKSGADLSVVTSSGEGIMHAAVYGNSLPIVNLLINAGCSVNVVSASGQNPLMAAITSKSDIQILSAMVAAGSDINLAEHSALHTPLHEAIHQHYNEAAKLLIDTGCDLLAQNKERQSALCLACQKGNDSIVMRLLTALPRPLVFMTLSAVPTHTAAKYGHAHILQQLAEGGCDINQLNLDGLTPLQVAVSEDNFAASRRLLQLGCDPDAHAKISTLKKCCITNEDPHPHLALEPLFLALTHRNLDLIRMLLNCYLVVPYRIARTLKAILSTSRELTVHFDPAMKRELAGIFHTHMAHPKSLLDICRCHIRSCLTFPLSVKVTRLPVAQKLRDYVVMKEVFEGWDHDDKLQEELSGRQGVFGWRGSTQ